MAKIVPWTEKEVRLIIDTAKRYRLEGKYTYGLCKAMIEEVASKTERTPDAVKNKYLKLRREGKAV